MAKTVSKVIVADEPLFEDRFSINFRLTLWWMSLVISTFGVTSYFFLVLNYWGDPVNYDNLSRIALLAALGTFSLLNIQQDTNAGKFMGYPINLPSKI